MFNCISYFCQYSYILEMAELSLDMTHGKRRRPAMGGDRTRTKKIPITVVSAWVWDFRSLQPSARLADVQGLSSG